MFPVNSVSAIQDLLEKQAADFQKTTRQFGLKSEVQSVQIISPLSLLRTSSCVFSPIQSNDADFLRPFPVIQLQHLLAKNIPTGAGN